MKNTEKFVQELNSLCEKHGLYLSMMGQPLGICDLDDCQELTLLHENQVETSPVYVLQDPDEGDPDAELTHWRLGG